MLRISIAVLFAVLGVAQANAVLPGVPGHEPPTTVAAPAPVAATPKLGQGLNLSAASLQKLIGKGASALVLNADGLVIGSVNSNGTLSMLAGWSQADIQAVQVTSAAGATQVYTLSQESGD